MATSAGNTKVQQTTGGPTHKKDKNQMGAAKPHSTTVSGPSSQNIPIQQLSKTYNLPSGETVEPSAQLAENLKKSYKGCEIERAAGKFIIDLFFPTNTAPPFEASGVELQILVSIADPKTIEKLEARKNEGKVLKTPDGKTVTIDQLLGVRKQDVHSPNVEKKLDDRKEELDEKDKELKAKDVEIKKKKAELEDKNRKLEENAKIIQSKDKIIDESNKKVEELKKENDKLKNENEKLEKEIKHVCDKYDSEKNMFETETRNLKSVINDKTKMIQQFEMQMEQYNFDYNELQKKLKASEERFELQRENFKQDINKLQEKLKDFEKKCQNLSGQVKREQKTNDFMKADHKDEIRKINSHIKDLIAERDDLKHRFSKLAGDKLTDQNPDIADLSDPYRAMKLSDKFGELYDDQWTDAFEALQKKKKNTREAIDILLNALQKCEDFFKKLREEQMDSLKNVLLHPSQDITKFGTDARKHVGGLKEHERITSADKKAMRELRRQVGVSDGVLEEVKQIFIMETKSWDEKKLLESCIPYLQKCAELCWLMVTHDPPLYMKIDVKQGDPMDLNIYNRYSSNGSAIDFLVWPALFNEKDGGLLSKGTAEPLRTVKKK